jgi:hypothetical protein
MIKQTFNGVKAWDLSDPRAVGDAQRNHELRSASSFVGDAAQENSGQHLGRYTFQP